MAVVAEKELYHACKTLFGSGIRIDRNFLFYLQPAGAKSAYRQMARKTHPDLCSDAAPHIYNQRTQEFQQISAAYQTLHQFLKERNKNTWSSFKNPPSTASGYRPTQPQRPRQQHPAYSSTVRYYQGKVPLRMLQFGLYLFYRGAISFRQLSDAVVWQRRQRPAIGRLALNWHWLDERQISTINRIRIPRYRFGEKAVKLGYLTPFQVRTLLRFQMSQHKKFGQYFIENGILNTHEVEILAAEMERHNQKMLTQQPFRHH